MNSLQENKSVTSKWLTIATKGRIDWTFMCNKERTNTPYPDHCGHKNRLLGLWRSCYIQEKVSFLSTNQGISYKLMIEAIDFQWGAISSVVWWSFSVKVFSLGNKRKRLTLQLCPIEAPHLGSRWKRLATSFKITLKRAHSQTWL